MKSNVNSDSAAANPNFAPPSGVQTSSGSSAASVPISVYRELAAELQATRVMLESLNTKNQQLAQQNQQLRKEVEQIVQLGLNLRHWVEAPPPVDPINLADRSPQPHKTYASAPSTNATAAAAAIAAKLRSTEADELSGERFTEEPARPLRPNETKPAKDLSGIWLTLTILFIILTAFGAGFLVMKPFLSGNR